MSVIGSVNPGDEQFIDADGNVYWFMLPERGPALGVSSSSPFAPKSTTGERSYADYDPFSTVALTDFKGGIGQEDMADTTKFHNARNVDSRSGRLVLGPYIANYDGADFGPSDAATILTRRADLNEWLTGSYAYDTWLIPSAGYDYKMAGKFTAPAGFDTIYNLWLPLRINTNAGTVTVKIYSDGGGAPDVLVATQTISRAVYDSQGRWTPVSFAAAVTLTAEADYWVIIEWTGYQGVYWAARRGPLATTTNTLWYQSGGTWAAPPSYCYVVMICWQDPIDAPTGTLAMCSGAGEDGITRIWGHSGRFVYYIGENLTPLSAMDGGSPSAVKVLSADVNDMLFWKSSADSHPYLYIALGDGVDMQKFDCNVGTEQWAVAWTGKQAHKLCVHDELLWCADETNMLAGTDGTTWPSAADWLAIGSKQYKIRNMVSWDGYLWIGKDDGLFKVIRDATYPTSGKPIVEKVIDFTPLATKYNFAAMCVHLGDLYFSIGNGLMRYSAGGVITSVSMDSGLDAAVSDRAIYKYAVSSLNALWVACQGNMDGPSTILCYHEGNWHNIVCSTYAGDMMGSIIIDPDMYDTMPLLFFSLSTVLCYIKMPVHTMRRWLWDGVDWAASGKWYSSWIDGNIRTVQKAWFEIEIDSQNCGESDTSNPYIAVYARVTEPANWKLIGLIEAEGIVTLPFAGSELTTSSTKIQLRLDLHSSATQTPIVRAIILKYLERPQDLRAFTRTYELSTRQVWRNGQPFQVSLQEQMAQLETLREKTNPITWYPWWGGSYSVHIVDYSGSEVRERRDQMADDGTIMVTVRLQALV